MSKKKDPVLPEEILKQYERVISALPGVERKGKSIPYTSKNGHMFSFLDKEGTMYLRLPDEDRKEFRQTYNDTVVMQYGKEMKEYVEVPFLLFRDAKSLSAYLTKSYDYVSSLKPKSTKK